MVVSAFIDIRQKEIPIFFPVMCAVLSTASVILDISRDEFNIANSIMSLLPGILMLVIAFLTREALGYGDGMMAFCIGPAAGFEGICFSLVLAMVLSSAASVILLLAKKGNRKTTIPFLPFFAMGMGVTLLEKI